jgi:enamine deaminase RidA (YjgF/YER057c/UK114 family)
MKYKRFVDVAGGWDVLQMILRALDAVSKKHGVSIANVATRWTLDHPGIAATIVGARLGERNHANDHLAIFSFALDADDRARIDAALKSTIPIAGDCGDEYRRAPLLTASGDLSHHLESAPKAYIATPVEGRPGRLRVSSGSGFEPIAGYSRAVRVGGWVLVSGTTATNGADEVVCRGDPAGQTTFILDKIAASLVALGASLDDVIRTRVYLANADDWEPVSRAHGRLFGSIRPANTMVEIGRLIGDYLVEIEVEALVE